MTHELDNFDFDLEVERIRHRLWVCREMIAGRRDSQGRRIHSADELSLRFRLLDEDEVRTSDESR